MSNNNYGPSSASNSGGSNRNSSKRNSNIVMTRGMINHNGFLNDPNANQNQTNYNAQPH